MRKCICHSFMQRSDFRIWFLCLHIGGSYLCNFKRISCYKITFVIGIASVVLCQRWLHEFTIRATLNNIFLVFWRKQLCSGLCRWSAWLTTGLAPIALMKLMSLKILVWDTSSCNNRDIVRLDTEFSSVCSHQRWLFCIAIRVNVMLRTYTLYSVTRKTSVKSTELLLWK